MNEGNRASKEDIDLENAIGDVFGQFDFGSVDKEEGTNHQLQQDQLEEQDKDQPQQPESKLEHYHTDTPLQDLPQPSQRKEIIAEPKQTLQHKDNKQAEHSQTNTTENSKPSEDELDLEDAIGDALDTVFGANHNNNNNHNNTDSNNDHQSSESDNQNDVKNAIENALGDIFTEVKTDTTTDDAADSHEKDKLTPELSTPIQQVKNSPDSTDRPTTQLEVEEPKDNLLETKTGEDLDDIIGKTILDLVTAPKDNKNEKDTDRGLNQKDKVDNLENSTIQQSVENADKIPTPDNSNENHLRTPETGPPKISTEDTNTTHEPTDEIKDKESIDKIDNNKGLTETNTSGDNTKTNLELNEEMDELDDVIGKAFQDAISKSQPTPIDASNVTDLQESKSQTTPKEKTNMSSSKVEQTVASFETESEPTNDSTELDQAIGDVFKQIINEDSSDTTKASPAPESVGDDDNMDLDAVIGDAFKSVLPTELPSKDKSLPLPPDDDDNDLENAIGEAFKSISDIKGKDRKQEEQVNDDELNAMIAQSFQKAVDISKSDSHIDNDDMENAITQAFKTAMAGTSATSQMSAREAAIRSLAVEISHQVQDHLKNDKFMPPLPFIPGLPQLDDNVLAHFQKVAYTDDDTKEQDKLKKTVSESTNSKTTQDNGGVAELENLQMNDILQNAFKMALENPQELLSDLDIDPTIQVPTTNTTSTTTFPRQVSQPQPQHIPASSLKFIPPTSNQGMQNYRKYPHQQIPEVQRSSTNTLIVKPIDKLESLENDSHKKPSLLSNPAVTSQLTSIISSLTSRINSGELSDANILQVIRQMTDVLASGGSLALFLKKPTSIQDVIVTYRDGARQKMLKSLYLTKIFLDQKLPITENEVKQKAIKLIDNIAIAFDPVGFTKFVAVEIKDEEFVGISSFLKNVLTTTSKHATTTKFSPTIINSIESVVERITQNVLLDSDNEEAVKQVSQDEELVKPITDLFSLLSGSSLFDNSFPMVVATAVSVAVTGYVYKEATGVALDTTIKAVCLILSNLFNTAPGMTFKGSANSTIGNQATKRLSDLILVGDLRRTKIDPDLGKTINNDNGKADAWNIDASSSIKIPQYRRPSALHEKSNVLHKPALTLPRSSPFISNKIGSSQSNSQPLQTSNHNNKLKRPGSFQRPSNAKPRATSLGFPKLHSTSFKYQ